MIMWAIRAAENFLSVDIIGYFSGPLLKFQILATILKCLQDKCLLITGQF